jgi:adenylate cyclase
MSRDPEQEYFSDGVTEDIITDLSKVSSLAVTARNTAFAYKGRNVDIVQTARRLNVSHVLEGSVRKVGDRVRITAQLIDGATGRHLWAERYDRDLHDIFAVQDEIAEAITAALKVRLLPSEKQAIEHRSTTNPEAYRIFLMARQFAAVANARRHETVVRLCRRAVELDPLYARAWALLAIAQANMRVIVAHSGDEVGCDAAERALALDPGLAEAHAARGRILAELGRYEEAWSEHRTALRLDPDSYDVHAAAGRCAVAMRNWDDAIAALERAASLLEADFWAPGMLIQCHEAKGDHERAQSAARRCLARAEKVIAAEPDHGSALGFGATALAALGDAERTREWAQRGLLLDPDNLNLKYNLACGLIALGEKEWALDLLAPLIAVAQREGLRWFEKDNSLDPIRDHQRFKDMMANAEARHAAAQGGGLHG